MKKRRHGIADMIHRVVLCSAEDVVIENGTMALSRVEVLETWAAINPTRGSSFGQDGAAIKEPREDASHIVKIRYRDNIEISVKAWIYERRLKSSPRWFHILKVKDVDEVQRYWEFTVRLVDRADTVIAPKSSSLVDMPEAGKW